MKYGECPKCCESKNLFLYKDVWVCGDCEEELKKTSDEDKKEAIREGL